MPTYLSYIYLPNSEWTGKLLQGRDMFGKYLIWTLLTAVSSIPSSRHLRNAGVDRSFPVRSCHFKNSSSTLGGY